MGCIHHHHSGNSSDYINSNKKYMLYYLAKGVKMNIILFKYPREMVKERRYTSHKPINWIPMGRSISNILEKMNFFEDLYTDVGKPFNGKNMNNMLMIS